MDVSIDIFLRAHGWIGFVIITVVECAFSANAIFNATYFSSVIKCLFALSSGPVWQAKQSSA